MNMKRTCRIVLAALTLAAFSHTANADLEETRQDIKRNAKSAGKAVGHGAVEFGHAVRDAAIEVGHRARDAGRAVGGASREGWEATKRTTRQIFGKDGGDADPPVSNGE